jgi:hypothetical protein
VNCRHEVLIDVDGYADNGLPRHQKQKGHARRRDPRFSVSLSIQNGQGPGCRKDLFLYV